jgi:enamine deaminase RidA (YjgF/YER057c/UK114 family)
VHYGDRKHLFISGTASIDSKGEVVHVGDVRRQTERMICNIEALLAEGGATMNDVQMAIVYLRDMGDYEQVAQLLAERLPELPYTITLAPVCRPTWLIEMECVAAVAEVNEKFAKF